MKAKTCKDYIVELKQKNLEQGGTGTAYALARMLNISDARMSNYTTGKKLFDDEMCFKTAFYLGISPLEIIASVNEERAKTPEKKKFWQMEFKRFHGATGLTLFALVMIFPTIFNPVEAAPFNISQVMRSSGPEYTLYEVARRHLRRLLGWLTGRPGLVAPYVLAA